MGLIVSLIIGGIVGWIASMVMKTNAQMGVLANVIVGVIGSSLGFWIAGAAGLSAAGPVMGWVVAVIGASVLIFVLKLLGIFK